MTAPAPSRDSGRVAEVSRLRRLTDLADRVAADHWRVERSPRGERWIVAARFDGSEQVICDLTRHIRPDEVELLSGALDQLTFFLPLIARAATVVRERDATIDQLTSLLERHAPEIELGSKATGPTRAPDFAAAEKVKDFAAQASMLLTNAVFQRFLSEARDGEVVDDKDSADAALKVLLGITSKKQLNTEDVARAAWLDLRARFSAFEKGYGE